jgi:hypothetical protein
MKDEPSVGFIIVEIEELISGDIGYEDCKNNEYLASDRFLAEYSKLKKLFSLFILPISPILLYKNSADKNRLFEKV